MSDVGQSSSIGTRNAGRGARIDLLGIYLNDHLAGSTVGNRRIHYMVRALRDSPLAEALRPIAGELAQDRASLLDIMSLLGVPARRYKILAAETAERAGRLKPNGRLVRRSPLTSVVELEFLQLGVEGKAAGWRMLRRLAESDGRLDRQQLDELIERARRQLRALEELRLQHAEKALRAR
ncbi:hypothetical protein N8I84_38630 [Streptomyces cynarae]|uniref:Uncharacterized protein n=1 Tax=Streptomyces cynarae TaxID=2981134 RepID=A0ABY6EB91_9ACTN|nr:hypothetical protein [Streptomyces cynarae]UXY23965.1 hypothetical protein N8I84_38630 [Streptomyces cynarae]